MSREQVQLVLRWAVESHSFAAQLGTDASLLTGYDLTSEERRALLDHDEAALRQLGVSERLLAGLAVIPRHPRRRLG